MGRNKTLQEMSDRIAKSAEETLRELRQDSKPTSGLDLLEELGREYDTVNVILKRRNENTGKLEVFSDQTGVLVTELLEKGYELYCKGEGGRGEYMVEIVAPSKEPGKKPLRKVKGPFHVGGAEQLPVAKSEINKMGMGGYNPFGNMFGLPTSTAAGNYKDNNTVNTMLKYIGDSSKESAGQMQGFLQMMFMEKMMGQMNPQNGSGTNGSQPNQEMRAMMEEIKSLRSERDRDRDRQATEERLRRQEDAQRDFERRMQDQFREIIGKLDGGGKKDDTFLEMFKMRELSGKSGDDNWLKFITMMRESDQSAQKRVDSLLGKLVDRPDGMDQFSKANNAMLENNVNMLNLVQQVVASGLAGGGGEKSWKDVAGEVLETVRVGFESRYGLEGQEQEMPYPIQTGPTQVMDGATGALPQQTPAQALPAQPQPEPEPESEAEAEVEDTSTDSAALKSVLLTSEELDSMERDRAAKQIFKALENNDYHEASARIFGLAYSDHSTYQRWFQVPGPLSGQILTHFKMPEHMLALAEDIGQLQEHMAQGGDPNMWSDNYKPVKTKKPAGGGVSSQLDGRPDFGLKQGDGPSDYNPVNASEVPPGVDPALAEQQRQERQRQSAITQIRGVRDNVGLYRAGKLNKAQVAYMRQNNLLPEDNEIEPFMAESEQMIAQLEAVAPQPTPAEPEKPKAEAKVAPAEPEKPKAEAKPKVEAKPDQSDATESN